MNLVKRKVSASLCQLLRRMPGCPKAPHMALGRVQLNRCQLVPHFHCLHADFGNPFQHYQLQGHEAARALLHHTTQRDVLTHHYISGTDGLAPVELRLGTLGITNPTFEVCALRSLCELATYSLSRPAGRNSEACPYIPGSIRNTEQKQPARRPRPRHLIKHQVQQFQVIQGAARRHSC